MNLSDGEEKNRVIDCPYRSNKESHPERVSQSPCPHAREITLCFTALFSFPFPYPEARYVRRSLLYATEPRPHRTWGHHPIVGDFLSLCAMSCKPCMQPVHPLLLLLLFLAIERFFGMDPSLPFKVTPYPYMRVIPRVLPLYIQRVRIVLSMTMVATAVEPRSKVVLLPLKARTAKRGLLH